MPARVPVRDPPGAALSPGGSLPRPAPPASVSRLDPEYRFLLAFSGLSSLMGCSVGMAQVAASLYALDLQASDTMLGLIAGAKSVGVLLMSIPVGVLVDRAGPARLFAIGTALAGAAYAVLPLHPSPGSLLLCTLAISFFMPLRFISLNTVFLSQLAALGEAKAGWYRGTHMIGMLLVGPVLGERAVAWLGFRWTYWTIALVFAATLLVAPIVFRPHAPPVDLAAGPRQGAGKSPLRARLVALLRDRRLLRLGLLESSAQAVNSYYTFFIVVIAVQVLQLGPRQASHLVAANGLTYSFSLFFLGGLVQRLGPRQSYVASTVAVSSALVVLALASSAPAIWAGGLLLGLALGTLQIANLTGFARIAAHSGAGKVSGINALLGPSGSLTGSALGAAIGPLFGLQAGFLVLAALFALLGAALLRQPPAPGAGSAHLRDISRSP